MPTAPPHPCSHPGCPALTTGRYCDGHAPEMAADERPAWRTTEGSASARGYGAHWRRLRLYILRRDPVCVICQRRAASVVDHITPKARGGTDDEKNLRGLCPGCHATKTGQDAHGGRTRGRRGVRGEDPHR